MKKRLKQDINRQLSKKHGEIIYDKIKNPKIYP